ncbi:MAG: hypothetical protein ACWA42_04685 [Lutibacter sp.]
MKKLYNLTVLILLIVPFSLFAKPEKGKITKKKTIHKTFKVNNDATLEIHNKFGNLEVISWNENKIDIEVTITISGKDEERVVEKLDNISVDFTNNSNYVSAKTKIENSSSWKIWKRSSNISMQINYVIKMPITNNVKLNNDYGGINIDKLEGTASINCDYGKIQIGELLNKSNKINIDYTNNSSIAYINEGNINADYSSLEIEKTNNIDLNADYSHIEFNLVKNLNFNCDYGSLKIEEAGFVKGSSDYMSTSIDKLNKYVDINVEYGSFKLKNLNENFEAININASYTPIKIDAPDNASFNIYAKLNYAGFNFDDAKFKFTRKEKDGADKLYEGYYNEANSSSNISIKSDYGSITIN